MKQSCSWWIATCTTVSIHLCFELIRKITRAVYDIHPYYCRINTTFIIIPMHYLWFHHSRTLNNPALNSPCILMWRLWPLALGLQLLEITKLWSVDWQYLDSIIINARGRRNNWEMSWYGKDIIYLTWEALSKMCGPQVDLIPTIWNLCLLSVCL